MSAPKAPAFQFYARDFLASTMFFTAEQVGAYIRLLCLQWENGGIPDDDAAISAATGCHGNAVAFVRQKFLPDSDGLLKNRRLEEVRAKQDAFRERQAKNAEKGWKKRRNKKSKDATAPPRQSGGNATDDAKPMPDGCSPSPSPNVPPIPPKNDSPPDPPPADECDEDEDPDEQMCALIWNGHPQTARTRSSQDRVRNAWARVPKKDRISPAAMAASLDLWRKSIDWVKENGQFVPGCHLWIKDRKWKVTPVPAPKTITNPIIGGYVSARDIGKI